MGGRLSPLWHGYDVKHEWDEFYFHAARLLDRIPSGSSSLDRDMLNYLGNLLNQVSADQPGKLPVKALNLPELLTDIRGSLDRVNQRIRQHFQAQIAVEARMDPRGGMFIHELGQFLDEFADRCPNSYRCLQVRRDWGAVAGLAIECDPLILDGGPELPARERHQPAHSAARPRWRCTSGPCGASRARRTSARSCRWR